MSRGLAASFVAVILASLGIATYVVVINASILGLYSASATMASLKDGGWQATENTEDAPDPYTGVQLVGFLTASAPDGEPIDLEFYERPEDAEGELAKTKKQEAPFDGTTMGNVMVLDDYNDTGAVSQDNLQALRNLLR